MDAKQRELNISTIKEVLRQYLQEIIEFCDPRIQGIKDSIEEAFGVNIDSHSLYFYGTKKD